jgi:hypothetical protein
MPKIIKAKGIYQSQFDVTDHDSILNDSDVPARKTNQPGFI